MRRYIILVVGLLLSVSLSAWSGKEHKLMAYIAEQHLTPNTKHFLERYLDQSIMGYASWMDRYRNSQGYEETSDWHVARVDDNFQPVMVMLNGHPAGLIDPLEHAIDVLSHYRDYNDSTVFISIVEVIHFVPELHCLSHYSFIGERKQELRAKAKGCKFVNAKGRSLESHTMWDSSISILHSGLNEVEAEALFDTWTEEEQAKACEGTVRDWMRETIQLVCETYDWLTPGKHKASEYLEEHKEYPENQFRRGAYRLAKVLNDLFDKEGGK